MPHGVPLPHTPRFVRGAQVVHRKKGDLYTVEATPETALMQIGDVWTPVYRYRRLNDPTVADLEFNRTQGDFEAAFDRA